MTKNTRQKIEPIISWILAMIICPLGVCFSAKSGFGVSMIEAPVYALFRKISTFWDFYTFGMSEYVVQGILLILMCLIIKSFKWKYLLSFATAFVFGEILDFWNYIFRFVETDCLSITARIIYAVVSCVIVSFAVSMFFRTFLPLEVWELFVKELTEKYNLNMTKVKWIYDISSLALGILLMLIFFRKFMWDIVGIGTIVTTFVNAPLIGGFTKLQDKFWSKFSNK